MGFKASDAPVRHQVKSRTLGPVQDGLPVAEPDGRRHGSQISLRVMASVPLVTRAR